MRFRSLIAFLSIVAIAVSACSGDEGGSSAAAECLDAVGELQEVSRTYEELLETGVARMRNPDAVEQLQMISDDYSELAAVLDARETMVPEPVFNAHELLANSVGMQASAWQMISDGLRLQIPDFIDDGAELIIVSRDLLAESSLALPDCSSLDS